MESRSVFSVRMRLLSLYSVLWFLLCRLGVYLCVFSTAGKTQYSLSVCVGVFVVWLFPCDILSVYLYTCKLLVFLAILKYIYFPLKLVSSGPTLVFRWNLSPVFDLHVQERV